MRGLKTLSSIAEPNTDTPWIEYCGSMTHVKNSNSPTVHTSYIL